MVEVKILYSVLKCLFVETERKISYDFDKAARDFFLYIIHPFPTALGYFSYA